MLMAGGRPHPHKLISIRRAAAHQVERGVDFVEREFMRDDSGKRQLAGVL
jgi:hypothetical protein